MATQDYAASIQGVSIRATRLDSAGNPLNGPGDSYTTSAFMRVSFTPEYEEGEEITEKGASGAICVSYKAPDTLKRITMELAICEPDSELSALLSGGLLLRKEIGGEVKSIGWAAPGVGDDPSGNGVALEVWSYAVKDGKRSAVLPYFHWIFPYVKLRQSGDRVIENGLLANTFEGYGLGNIAFGTGPDSRWEFPVASERPYAYARADWAPTGLHGFYTWSDNDAENRFFTKGGIQGATDPNVVSITAVNTTATITLSGAAGGEGGAGVVSGDKIAVSNAGDVFNTVSNGVVAAVSGNTITYTVSDVGETPVNASLTKFTRVTLVNSVTEVPSYTAVTSADLDTAYGGVDPESFNVPGNKNFTEDQDVDLIIRSVED